MSANSLGFDDPKNFETIVKKAANGRSAMKCWEWQ